MESEAAIRRIIDAAGLPGTEREAEIPFVFSQLPKPPARILDVGCCYSQFIIELAQLDYEVYGVDIQNLGFVFPRFIQCDARDLPFKSAFFDCVTAISAIEHFGLVQTPYHSDAVEDPEADRKALKEIARVLRPMGRALITLPYGKSDGSMDHWVKFYTYEIIQELVRAAGMYISCYDIRGLRDGIWCRMTREEGEEAVSDSMVRCNIGLVLMQ